jgi:NAD(P)H-hydrate repair Nnr-like enzyme with NAD(P)H-hydrate dehydratase domain
VIGPGLGRTKIMSVFFRKFIEVLPENTNIVIDADGLFFLC